LLNAFDKIRLKACVVGDCVADRLAADARAPSKAHEFCPLPGLRNDCVFSGHSDSFSRATSTIPANSTKARGGKRR
jgi:hypothetical protein